MICYKYNNLYVVLILTITNKLQNLILKILFQTLNIVKTKYCVQLTGYLIKGDLKIITDSRIQSIICKGPKYRFPLPIDFKSCREEIAGDLQEFVIAGVNESMLSLMP